MTRTREAWRSAVMAACAEVGVRVGIRFGPEPGGCYEWWSEDDDCRLRDRSTNAEWHAVHTAMVIAEPFRPDDLLPSYALATMLEAMR